jgi:hypothetical protein
MTAVSASPAVPVSGAQQSARCGSGFMAFYVMLASCRSIPTLSVNRHSTRQARRFAATVEDPDYHLAARKRNAMPPRRTPKTPCVTRGRSTVTYFAQHRPRAASLGRRLARIGDI